MYIPRAQALSETFSQNPQTPLISSAFCSFPKNEFCSKATHSEYQTQRKTKLVTGGTLSTIAQTYSWFSSSFRYLSSTQQPHYYPLTALAFSPLLHMLASPASFRSHSLSFCSSSPTQPSFLVVLLKPTPLVLMKMRCHSYTHQKQKLHACPCRIKERQKPKTTVT